MRTQRSGQAFDVVSFVDSLIPAIAAAGRHMERARIRGGDPHDHLDDFFRAKMQPEITRRRNASTKRALGSRSQGTRSH